jgi:hypothetical protein
MSAVAIGLAWVLIAMAAFVALSTSALAKTRGELEVDPRGPRTGTQWPAIEAARTNAVLRPTNVVLRSSPSVVRMQAPPSRLEPVLLS